MNPRFKDHQIRDTVNELRSVAIQYGHTQQLRERISHVITPQLKAAQAMEQRFSSMADALQRCVVMLRDASEPSATQAKADDGMCAQWDVDAMALADHIENVLLGQADETIPAVLFDGHAVLTALTEKARKRTSPDNVTDVLDAVVKLMREERSEA